MPKKAICPTYFVIISSFYNKKTTSITDIGTAAIQHKNYWITVNHDIFYTRSSPTDNNWEG